MPPDERFAPERFASLRADGRLEELDDGVLAYTRVADDGHGVDRGVIRIAGRVIPVYPSIGRFFALGAGVRNNFAGPFRAERKVDGYNVRVVRIDGRLLAFTRGGYLCPFSTDRLPDFGPLDALFDRDPELVLCGEIAGPDNPYMDAPEASVASDVAFFAFDLMRQGESGFLPLDQRDELLGAAGIRQAPFLGRFRPDETDDLLALARRLDGEAAEGMVLKPEEPGRPRFKWVTPRVNLSDIVGDAELLAELPPAFFVGRIVRLVVGIDELGFEDRLATWERRLGRALFEELERALEEVRTRGTVSKSYTVHLRSADAIDPLLAHLARSRSVRIEELSREEIDGRWRLRFRKVFRHSSDWLGSVLSGQPVTD